MKFGLHLPQVGPSASPEALAGTAQMAEEAGFDSVWVFDRLLYPVKPRTPYPAGDGSLPDFLSTVYEPMVTLTWLASKTRHIRLGTGVLVSAFRSPALLARMAATLDVLSAGRFICGIGMGWSQDEYEASGIPFDRKGARFDEYLQVLRSVWTEEEPSFGGRFYTLPRSIMRPHPVQTPHVPLWVGGDSDAAMNRALSMGTGWYLSGYVPLAEMAGKIEAARRQRPDSGFTIACWAPFAFTTEPHAPLVGPLEHVVSHLQTYEQMGVQVLVLLPGAAPGSDPARDVERFLREVRPRLEATSQRSS